MGHKDDNKHAVDLPLDIVLGKMPAKVYNLERTPQVLPPLQLPEHLSVLDALDRVLRLPSVGSEQFLTNKVDRSVTGNKNVTILFLTSSLPLILSSLSDTPTNTVLENLDVSGRLEYPKIPKFPEPQHSVFPTFN